MKLRNFVLISGLLLLSIAPVFADNSVVPWSWRGALGSVSSVLSGVSALSTETKIAALGGLSVLTSGYIGYIRGKNALPENDPNNHFREVIEASLASEDGIKKVCSQKDRYIGYADWQYYTEQSINRCKSSVKKPEDNPSMLPSLYQRSIFKTGIQKRVLGQVSPCELNFVLAAVRAQEQKREIKQIMEKDILSKITKLPQVQEVDSGMSLSPRQLDDLREVRALEALKKARSSARKREGQANKGKKGFQFLGYDYSSDKDLSEGFKKLFEQSDSGFLVLDDQDCDSYECLVQKGKRYMELANRGKVHQIPTGAGKATVQEEENEFLESLLALTLCNKTKNSPKVMIQNEDLCDLFIRYWCQRNQRENQERNSEWFKESSTYIGNNGSLILALPESVRQHYKLSDKESYFQLFLNGDKVIITLQEEEPTAQDSWVECVKSGASQAQDLVAKFAESMEPSIKTASKALGETCIRWSANQGNLLREASACGNRALVLWALAKGADVNDSAMNNDKVGLRPLHAAIENGHTGVVSLLLQAGANPNYACRDNDRDTILPIHLAAARGYTDIVELLIKCEVDLSTKMIIKSSNGTEKLSALDLAKKHGHIGIVRKIFKRLYPQTYGDMYGKQPKLRYLNTCWGAFGVNTPGVVQWKLHFLGSAYKEVLGNVKRRIGSQKLDNISFRDLKSIKDQLDSDYACIDKRQKELYVIISNGSMPIKQLLSNWEKEFNGNKLSIEPEECYAQLGYATWRDGCNALHTEVKQRLQDKKESSNVSESEKATTFRQIGYYFKDSEKKRQFDTFLKVREALLHQGENQEEDADCLFSDAVSFELSPDQGDVVFHDVDGMLAHGNLGKNAEEFTEKYCALSTCDALMEIKEMQSKITRELKKRDQ